MLFIEYKTLRRKERRGEGYEKEMRSSFSVGSSSGSTANVGVCKQ